MAVIRRQDASSQNRTVIGTAGGAPAGTRHQAPGQEDWDRMTYTAPLADIRFTLREVAGFGQIAGLPGYEHASEDAIGAVLDEAGKLAAAAIAPCPIRWSAIRGL
jgi:hypothetical protein